MSRLEKVSSFSMAASQYIHEFQREPSRSAGYVGSGGDADYLRSLNERRARTDLAQTVFLNALEKAGGLYTSAEQKKHVAEVKRKIDAQALTRHKRDAAQTQLIVVLVAGVIVVAFEQRMSTSSFSEFLGKNRQAIEGVAKQVSGLNEVSRVVSQSSMTITEEVAKMAEVSRDANQAIPQIVQRAVAAADNRRENRVESNASVILSTGQMSEPVTLKDVSGHGARISKPSEGRIKIELPNGMGAVEGKTAWSSETESGVEFSERLDDSLIMKLIKQYDDKSAA